MSTVCTLYVLMYSRSTGNMLYFAVKNKSISDIAVLLLKIKPLQKCASRRQMCEWEPAFSVMSSPRFLRGSVPHCWRVHSWTRYRGKTYHRGAKILVLQKSQTSPCEREPPNYWALINKSWEMWKSSPLRNLFGSVIVWSPNMQVFFLLLLFVYFRARSETFLVWCWQAVWGWRGDGTCVWVCVETNCQNCSSRAPKLKQAQCAVSLWSLVVHHGTTLPAWTCLWTSCHEKN